MPAPPSTEYLQRVGMQRLRSLGSEYIIGVDEVGLGSWAGPVFVCAAVARANWSHPRVKDSKKMEKDEHIRVYNEVLVPPTIPFRVILGMPNTIIDAWGVHRVLNELVYQAVNKARAHFPEAVAFMDGNQLPPEVTNALCMPKADHLVAAVSAASIMAKKDRDEAMREFHEEYPSYGFDTNAGYRSPKHLEGLERLGTTPIHRLSYGNMAQYVRGGSPAHPQPATISRWPRQPNGMRVSTSSNKP